MRNLDKSISINGLTLKNRLVMPPMATSSANDGEVSQRILDYYDKKTKGGYIGLVITEHSYIDIQGMANPKQMSVAKDSDIKGLKQLVNIIHNNGSKAFAQINHAGSMARGTGLPTVSASNTIPITMKESNIEIPEELSKEQIQYIVKRFADAARRVKLAGFDGVEIHSAHAYLLNQFYSPITNHRTDEYTGTTLEGRLRIHKEVIEAVRSEVGEDFPIALRLGGCDYMAGGSTIKDYIKASQMLESYGVDILDITGGINRYMIPWNKEPGYFSDMTEHIMEKVSIPVILTGGITNAMDAEKLLQLNKADLIGVGRAILKDDSWAKNAMEQK